MTKEELIEVLDHYIEPFYYLVGAALAVIVILLAVLFVIKPFWRVK